MPPCCFVVRIISIRISAYDVCDRGDKRVARMQCLAHGGYIVEFYELGRAPFEQRPHPARVDGVRITWQVLPQQRRHIRYTRDSSDVLQGFGNSPLCRPAPSARPLQQVQHRHQLQRRLRIARVVALVHVSIRQSGNTKNISYRLTLQAGA